MELSLACGTLVLWCFIMGVVCNGGMYHLGVEGLQIATANLFYATWISFALSSYIVADLATIDDTSGVVPYHYSPTNQASRSWILLLIASLVLLSFSLEVGTGKVCSGGILQDANVCRYTIAGMVFGFLGVLASLGYLLVERVFPDNHQSLGIMLSVAVTISFAINAGLLTSPGSPGSEPSNLYWASWICLALSFYLCVCHVEMYMASKTTPTKENIIESSEQVPLVQHNRMPTPHKRAVSKSSIKESLGGSMSESTYSDTTSSHSDTSYDDDDDSSSSESTGDDSKSELVLLLAQDEVSNLTQPKTGTQAGGSRFSLSQVPQGPPAVAQANNNVRSSGPKNTLDPKKQQQRSDASRAMKKNSLQATEEKKKMLFEKMDFAPNRDDKNRATRVAPVGNNNTAVDKSGFEQNLQQYLKGMGLPQGLVSTISRNYKSCDSRLWLIDNSLSMKVKDSHLIGGSLENIQKKDNVSRWEEMRESVAFHAKMAARCWIPTKFWLVNDPGPSLAPGLQKFCLCWKTPRDITSEMNQVRHIMTTATPQLSKNPLANQIRSVHRGISKEASRLSSQGKHITFVMCTQGVPTDAQGKTGPGVLKEFEQELLTLSKLPVKIVFRLCTDDTKVMDIYNAFDSKFDFCDVLDDYWGESMEVYLHNPWLAYGIGIHRLREAGLAWGLMDALDERPLLIDEIHQFCKMLFLGENRHGEMDLPHPRDWMNFMQRLTQLVKKENQIWNPVSKRKTPWINLAKIRSMYGAAQGQSPRPPPTSQPPQRQQPRRVSKRASIDTAFTSVLPLHNTK